MPSLHAIAVLLIALTAFYLYTRPWIRMELVSLLLLIALVLLFHFYPLADGAVHIDDASILSGFGHPALIAILCLMILGRGLLVTGALEPAVRVLTRLWKWSPSLGLLLTLVFAMTASAFVYDTPVLVMMLPMLTGIAERTGTSASRTLMPVNFAVLGGGIVTALGTSTNLLILSIAAGLGVAPIGIFDFTAISAGALAIALPYLWLVAPRLLPDTGTRRHHSPRRYEARILVDADSRLAGKSLEQGSRALGRPLPLLQLARGGATLQPEAASQFATGDALIVADTPAGLRELATTFATELFNRDGPGRFVEQESGDDDQGIVELVIGPKSPQSGHRLRDTRFAEQFGVVVIALHRSDEDLLRVSGHIGDIVLLPGDLLLVQGPLPKLEALRGQWDLMMLDSRVTIPRTPKAPLALGIMAGVIALAAFKVLPIHIAALLGVALLIWRGGLLFEHVGRALSLEVVLLVVASLALGQCLVGSGAADWLASGAVAAIQHLSPALQIASVMTLAAVLTNFVSNSAAAAIGTPIAVTMARQLGITPEPFVLATLFGANLSYATPMAYQTNMLIMTAAGYRFGDFVRVGLPLLLMMLAALSFLLVRHYGL